jgi:ankyrin repeat protein
LIEMGLNVEAVDKDGYTPLHAAASNRHGETVRFLVRIANVNASDVHGRTPLHLAIIAYHTQIINVLIACGADVCARDRNMWTPLHIAVYNGHTELVSMLVEKGCDVSARDEFGETPLHKASFYGHTGIARELVRLGAHVEETNESGDTPLHKAVHHGHAETIEALALLGAQVDRIGTHGTAFAHALRSANLRVCLTLIKLDADVRGRSKEGTPLIHLAAQNGFGDVVWMMLERGADADDLDDASATPLHRAAERGHAEVVRVIAERTKQIDARDANKCTPLHLAAREGKVEAMRELLRCGADANAHNAHVLTPLHCAVMSGNEETIRELVGEGKGIEIDARDESGQTALHIAANSGNFPAAQVLLDYKADPNAQNANLQAPLVLAVKNGHAKIVGLLIERGGLQDRETAKQLLSVASNSGRVEVVQVLVKYLAAGEPPPSVQEEQKDCTVCLEKCEAPVKIGCGHYFCWACVVALQAKSFKECPNCRAKFDHIVF